MTHDPWQNESHGVQNPSDEIERWLRELPTLPAPKHTFTHYWGEERESLQMLTACWLLLLLPAVWLMHQSLAVPISKMALQATPYPLWESLLHRAHEALQIGWQFVQEVLR